MTALSRRSFLTGASAVAITMAAPKAAAGLVLPEYQGDCFSIADIMRCVQAMKNADLMRGLDYIALPVHPYWAGLIEHERETLARHGHQKYARLYLNHMIPPDSE